MVEKIRKSCPVCEPPGETLYPTWYRGSDKQIKRKIGAYNECTRCYSAYTPIIPSLQTINKRVNHWGKRFVKESATEPISKSSRDRLTFISRYIEGKTKKLIDVGCGSGNFLKCAKQARYEVYGMDICLPIVEYLQSIGIPMYSSLKKIKSKNFDVATCFDVIEHTTKPQLFLQEIKQVIKKGGLLMITTPNSKGISAIILKKRWWVFGENDHYVLFNPQSLRSLLEKTGFTILDLQTDTITQWFHFKNIILNKLANKFVYLLLLPFKSYLFKIYKGDNIQILARMEN